MHLVFNISKNFVLSFAMVCTLLAGVNVVAFAADDNDLIVSVHSFYNDATKGGDGEHLYTKDLDEMSWLSSLPTWNDEDEAWKAPVSSSLAVYRVYNPNSGEHHYAAADEAEWLVSQGWTQEKIAFYSDDNMGVPIYRLWNGGEGVGSLYYTTDEGEAAYLASIGWTAEGVNFYGVKEEGEKEMTAEQSGANEITVVTTDAFTGVEEFTVTSAYGDEEVLAVDFSDNMDKVYITLADGLEEIEYTVTCSDTDYNEAVFYGEETEITSLSFLSDNLVLSADGTYAQAYYVILDQWGNPVEDGTEEFVAGGYNAVGGSEDGEGVLMISAASGSTLTVGTVIPVSAVYAGSTKVATETFTVSAQSVVANMMVGDLIVNPNLDAEKQAELEGQRITSARLNEIGLAGTNYLLPVIATDQYGMPLDADTLNAMYTNGLLYVTPTVGIGEIATKAGIVSALEIDDDIFIEGEDGVVLIAVAGNGSSYGTGVLNFLSIGGFSATKNIKVEQSEMINSLDVTLTSDLIYGQPTPIILSAKDQYGAEVDLTDEDNVDIYVCVNGADPSGAEVGDLVISYNGSYSTLNLAEGVFADMGEVNPDYEGIFAAVSAPDSGIDFMTITPASKAVSIKQLTVKAPAYPKTIVGLSEDVDTVIGPMQQATGGINFSTEGTFVFKDQYGQVVDGTFTALPTYSEDIEGEGQGYYYTIEASGTPKYTELDVATGKIDAQALAVGPGSDTYVVKLWSVDDQGTATQLNKKTFKVTLAGEAVTYVAGFMNGLTQSAKTTLYTGEADADTADLVVYGIDSAGNMFIDPAVTLTATPILRNAKVGGATLAVSNGAITVETAGTTGGTAYVDLYGVDDETGELELLTTASIECSVDAPVAVAVVAFDSEMEAYDYSKGIELDSADYTAYLVDGMVIISNGNPASDMDYIITSVDQYGRPVTEYVLWNFEDVTETGIALDEDGYLIITDDDLFVSIPITVGI